MIKFLIVACLVQTVNAQTLKPQTTEKIVESIYKLEGGTKTKFPFGIKSIDTKGNVALARAICRNTVNNNFKRYNQLAAAERQKYHCYLDFLADRYCPPSADRQGNLNWKKNIHILISK